jgi:hypothetical protein
VFGQHPYDKGDLVVLPSEQKDLKLVVEEIYLMHTSFQPVERGKDIHIPHSKLSSDCIENWTRLAQADKWSRCAPAGQWSKPKGDQSPISVVIHLDPQKKLPLRQDMWDLKGDITKYCRARPSRYYFTPTLTRVPIKDKDLIESGIKVEFPLKRKVQYTLYISSYSSRY